MKCSDYVKNLERVKAKFCFFFFLPRNLERVDGLCLRGTCYKQSILCTVGLRWWRRCIPAAEGTKQLSLFMDNNQQLIHNVRILLLWKKPYSGCWLLISCNYFTKNWQIYCLALVINFYNSSSCHGQSCNSEILNTSGFFWSLREVQAYTACLIS